MRRSPKIDSMARTYRGTTQGSRCRTDRLIAFSRSKRGEVIVVSMIEAGWLACRDYKQMLAQLRRLYRANVLLALFRRKETVVSGRKLRLLACAYCRDFFHLYANDRIRHIVDLAEQYADGRLAKRDLAAFVDSMIQTERVLSRWKKVRGSFVIEEDDPLEEAHEHATTTWDETAVWTASPNVFESLHEITWIHALEYSAIHAEAGVTVTHVPGLYSCNLIREIFPNPYRPVELSPSNLHSDKTIASIARCIYEERQFNDLPILADALEEAGCTDQRILSHCRLPAKHFRGCWVVDLVLPRPV